MKAKGNIQRIYGIDCDDTMALAGAPRPGPVTPEMMKQLMDEGNIVGCIGNFEVMFRYWPLWYTVISFLGGHTPLTAYKPQFMHDLKYAIQFSTPYVTDFVMVGNPRAEALAGYVSPTSNDDGWARIAGWRFINARDLANGHR